MQSALRDRPQPEFPVPEGIDLVRIDPATGKLASAEGRGVLEPFKTEAKPVENPPDKPQVEMQDLFGE